MITAIIVGDPPEDAHERHAELAERARAIFAGEHPAIVGSVLAEMLAIFIIGHQISHEDHERLLDLHVKTVRELLPIVEAEMNDMMGASGPKS